MEFTDLHETLASFLQVVRQTLRTELTSAWLPIQLGLIALSVLIALGISITVRRRVDLVSLTMGWPPYLRMVVRALVTYLGPIAFILVVIAIRAALRADIVNPRTYLLGIAISLTRRGW